MNYPKKYVTRKEVGLSLIEMLVVVAIMLTLLAIVPPLLMNAVNSVRTRYAGTNLVGLLQHARMDAVKGNGFYSVQNVVVSGRSTFFSDESKPPGLLVPGDPQESVPTQVTVHLGPGSGAPGEAAYLGNLAFPINPANVPPSFNARGMPCVPNGSTCTYAGSGFVLFVSNQATFGSLNWMALVVTPSARFQVWEYDGSNWIQQ